MVSLSFLVVVQTINIGGALLLEAENHPPIRPDHLSVIDKDAALVVQLEDRFQRSAFELRDHI